MNIQNFTASVKCKRDGILTKKTVSAMRISYITEDVNICWNNCWCSITVGDAIIYTCPTDTHVEQVYGICAKVMLIIGNKVFLGYEVPHHFQVYNVVYINLTTRKIVEDICREENFFKVCFNKLR